ncbi:hypothetical protein FQZ97_1213780 [compost metagenome]
MRHHTEYITAFITYTGNVKCSTIWVYRIRDRSVLITVSEDDLVVFFQFLQCFRISMVAAFTVCYRNFQGTVTHYIRYDVVATSINDISILTGEFLVIVL